MFRLSWPTWNKDPGEKRKFVLSEIISCFSSLTSDLYSASCSSLRAAVWTVWSSSQRNQSSSKTDVISEHRPFKCTYKSGCFHSGGSRWRPCRAPPVTPSLMLRTAWGTTSFRCFRRPELLSELLSEPLQRDARCSGQTRAVTYFTGRALIKDKARGW